MGWVGETWGGVGGRAWEWGGSEGHEGGVGSGKG